MKASHDEIIEKEISHFLQQQTEVYVAEVFIK
jgi:hypothetical protein